MWAGAIVNGNNMKINRHHSLSLTQPSVRLSFDKCFRHQEFEKPHVQRDNLRLGAATVEFAVILPVFLLSIILPMIEFSRALIVTSSVASTAQIGCRAAVLPGSTNASVNTAVINSLTAMRINGPNPTVIKVNGVNKELSDAMQGDEISVTVSVPYNNTSWLPLSICNFFGNATSSSTQVMRRE